MARNIKIVASIVICRKHRTIFPRLFITADDKNCIELEKNIWYNQFVWTVFTWYKVRSSSFIEERVIYNEILMSILFKAILLTGDMFDIYNDTPRMEPTNCH